MRNGRVTQVRISCKINRTHDLRVFWGFPDHGSERSGPCVRPRLKIYPLHGCVPGINEAYPDNIPHSEAPSLEDHQFSKDSTWQRCLAIPSSILKTAVHVRVNDHLLPWWRRVVRYTDIPWRTRHPVIIQQAGSRQRPPSVNVRAPAGACTPS